MGARSFFNSEERILLSFRVEMVDQGGGGHLWGGRGGGHVNRLVPRAWTCEDSTWPQVLLPLQHLC